MPATQRRRRPPPRRPPPRRRPGGAERKAAPASTGRLLLAAVGVIGALVAWRVGSAVLGGDEPELPGAGTQVTASPTPTEEGRAGVPASTAEVAEDFPLPAIGTRLEFKILGLGDDPQRCTAVGLLVGDDQRTVYHHLCGRDADARSDVYFFLIRIVNHSGAAQPIALDNFALATRDGGRLQALDVESAGASSEHYFPERIELGRDSRIKRFVAFDATPAFTPASLTYVDGSQALIVHLRGTWVGA